MRDSIMTEEDQAEALRNIDMELASMLPEGMPEVPTVSYETYDENGNREQKKLSPNDPPQPVYRVDENGKRWNAQIK